MYIEHIAQAGKKASYQLAQLTTEQKNQALQTLRDSLLTQKEVILAANKKDLDAAKLLLDKGEISQALLNRLKLDENKFQEMIQGLEGLIKLGDPIGKILHQQELDTGLCLIKKSCPLGVIAVIFEARPDVIVQISALCIKTGNAAILKGGSEALHTNLALMDVIEQCLRRCSNFPAHSISYIQKREEVQSLLACDQYIDLIIPRGSNALVKHIKENTKIPVLGHADGICHIYVGPSADAELSCSVCLDSKTQYPSACNAVETILIHQDVAQDIQEKIVDTLLEHDVEVRVEEELLCQLSNPQLKQAKQSDWSTEYSDKIVSIKQVPHVEAAVEHINHYGSGHTDCIISQNQEEVEYFMQAVDSAGVYHNVSTRFADGYRYGFGAEVGISTNKTHARGPVGLDGLVSYKYLLLGDGHIVAQYSGPHAKKFLHQRGDA